MPASTPPRSRVDRCDFFKTPASAPPSVGETQTELAMSQQMQAATVAMSFEPIPCLRNEAAAASI
jgi:hypothetical protein